MLSNCLKRRNNTERKSPRVTKTKTGKTMLLSNFLVCNTKISRFFK